MLRCTIELIPFGDETKTKKLGIIEIANDGTGTRTSSNYIVTLRKTPPWKGALKDMWKIGCLASDLESDIIMAGEVEGFDRQKRGPYDLLLRALRACGLDKRNA